jgi:hypothetical protein
MSDSAPATPAKPKPGGLPYYYLVIALATVMLLVLAGGFIYYRLVTDAMVERVQDENRIFASRVDKLADAVIRRPAAAEALEEAIRTEMDKRPVVLVRVYDDDDEIRFSTNPSEVGEKIADDYRYWYEDVEIEHFDVLDSGSETLRGRDIVVTRAGVGGADSYWQQGIEVYADVTSEHQGIIQTALISTGVIELILAAAIAVVLVRKR